MKPKEAIKKFVSAVMDKEYKKADQYINAAVSEKIKQKIINNNNNLF